MPNKPPGGRGKRESYSTSVVRVPNPVKAQVLELVKHFHQNRATEGTIPVTSLLPEQLPVTLVAELIEAAFPKELKGDSLPTAYDISWRQASKQFDKQWELWSRYRIEKLHKLIDRVNRSIWTIDNSFAITHLETDIYIAIAKLVEFGLLHMDSTVAPIAGRSLAEWIILNTGDGRSDINDYIFKAFQSKRFDILKGLEVGEQLPINRHDYWHEKYKNQLATPGINYWRWRQNPESREICPELTQLLSLPSPPPQTCEVLELLAEGKDPFLIPKVNFMEAYQQSGKLAHCAPDVKQAYRQAFIQWHLSALTQLGEDILKNIYRVVYGCGWQLVQTIINPIVGEWWEVLGVPPTASKKEVKVAHRRLAKLWHPDVSSSPLATERMVCINKALEEFQKTCKEIP